MNISGRKYSTIIVLVAALGAASCGTNEDAQTDRVPESTGSHVAPDDELPSGRPWERTAEGIADYAEPTPENVTELAQRGDIAVLAEAEAAEHHVRDGESPDAVYTLQTLRVVEQLWGEPQDQIVVRFRGGVTDETAPMLIENVDEPQFRRGQHYLLILEAGPSGHWVPVGAAAGRYPIQDGVLATVAADWRVRPASDRDPADLAEVTNRDVISDLAGRTYEDVADELRRTRSPVVRDAIWARSALGG